MVSDLPPPSVPLHSPGMIREELESMLGITPGITAGQFMSLYLLGSPVLTPDAPLTSEESSAVFGILPDFASIEDVRRSLATAWRGVEIIQAQPSRGRSSYDGIGPEWLVDIYARAASVMPTLTWEDYLWGTPLCLVTHLVACAHRTAGSATARPEDTTAAEAWLTARAKQRKESNEQEGTRD